MKALNLITICLILFLCSCQQTAKKNTGTITVEDESQFFENEYLNFTYPLDWKITEDKIFDESSQSITIEKKGFDSSGMVMIILVNELLDQNDILREYMAQMDSNKLIQNFTYNDTVSTEFKNSETKSNSYNFTVLGLEHSGIAKSFNKNNLSILYIEQEADEDREKNTHGFNIIRKSLSLK